MVDPRNAGKGFKDEAEDAGIRTGDHAGGGYDGDCGSEADIREALYKAIDGEDVKELAEAISRVEAHSVCADAVKAATEWLRELEDEAALITAAGL